MFTSMAAARTRRSSELIAVVNRDVQPSVSLICPRQPVLTRAAICSFAPA